MRVLFLVANGSEDSEFITTRDILKRGGIDVLTASINDIDVELSHSINIMADTVLTDKMPLLDAIIIPGGMKGVNNLLSDKRVLKLLKEYFDKGLLVGAICAAPLVLYKAGILNGIEYTCYKGIEEEIHEGIYKDLGVIKSKNVITAKSMYYSIDFGLEIVEYLMNKETKERIMKGILMV